MKIGKSLKIISLTALVGVIFIGCGEKVTFKGQDYKVITSPITGKKWLDRNLGATQACTSSTDKACYGDYYQWGRLADGHEKASSSLTTSRVKDVSDIGNKFVVKYKDWTLADNEGSVRKVQWAKIDGTGVCPVGFRVPTQTELRAETIGYFGSDNTSTGAVKVIDSATAFQNFLKLPVAGIRTAFDGSIMNQNSIGFLWTIASNENQAQLIGFGGSAKSAFDERAMGFSIRCIESKTSDVTDTIPPQITSASSYSVPENKISSFTIVANDDSDITYSLEGVDSSYFIINSSTGEFKFKTEPDYETKNSYSIIVKARDSENNNSTQNVNISIIDEEEFQSGQIWNGFIYNIITSPITGKKWLDRNLGASQVCTSSTDTACYGDYFQWGRLADGHEKTNSTTIATLATGISNVGNSFITGTFPDYEWTKVDNDGWSRTSQWSKLDGKGVCPLGFRVPTIDELKNETIRYAGINDINIGAIKVINIETGFQNFLKIPAAGIRGYFTGSIDNQGSSVDVWSSTAGESLDVTNHSIGWGSGYPANGLPIRCIGN